MSLIDKAAGLVNKLPTDAASAKIVGLGIATVVVLGWSTISWVADATKPFEIPTCYWEGRGGAYEPGKADPATLYTRPIDRGRFKWDIDTVKEAMELCKPEACDGAAARKYRSAITGYTSTRMQMMLNADMKAGERGMKEALRRYTTKDHADIIAGMRERVQSGVYKLTGNLQNEDAIRMLVYNPVDTFRPCRVKKYENQWLW